MPNKKTPERRRTIIRLILKIFTLFLLACAAAGFLWYATTPKRFEKQKTIQISRDVESYFSETARIRKEMEQAPEERLFDELYRGIESYNKDIYDNHQAFMSVSAKYTDNDPRLDLKGAGLPSDIFAIIKIPKMELTMPLYLGANDENLANGAAVIAQTSVPIGGENSNSVISAHRGWNGYPYFLHIEKLEIGDSVFITNFWETLEYRVVDIQVVMPDDFQSILIRPGKDMITLLTCHPPDTGGRYRYLVFCERVLSENENIPQEGLS